MTHGLTELHLAEPQLTELAVPRSGEAPLFAAPWEATAFALVVSLHRAGLFDWGDWVALLAAEIAAGPPDPTGERYYEFWARALEKLVARLDLVTPAALAGRSEAWRAAYLATPHGREVRLENAAGRVA